MNTALGTDETYERVPAILDTDAPEDFILRTAGNATPGVVTVPEPGTMLAMAPIALAMLRRKGRA